MAEDGANGGLPVVEKEEVVYERYGRIIDRTFRYPNGSSIAFDVFFKNFRNHGEFVQIFPFDTATQSITMIREFAPASGDWIWGIPGGNVEDAKGSNREVRILESARRELQEEAGLAGGEFIPLLDPGKSILQDKYQQDRLLVYICLNPKTQQNVGHELDPEEIIQVHHGVPISVVKQKMREGKMQANNIAGCSMAIEKLRELGHITGIER